MEKSSINKEKVAQNNPASTTVVNFGVWGFQRKVTVNKAKPLAEIKPNKAPATVPWILSLTIIIIIPTNAIIIAIRVLRVSNSPKKKYPKTAAINGIAASIKRVTAAVVMVIE